ncbi:MAG: TonB-dependent receptor [Bacteroidetes bacterium]|nr:TonB-dependent receptor [Bacteroidota bacterium]
MYFKKWLIAPALFCATLAQAQTSDSTNKQTTVSRYTQKIHGIVTDAASKQPLAGVIVVLQSNININAITDDKGFFEIENVPVGRQNFMFKLVGFEDYMVQQAMIISGKETDLSISMTESLKNLKEVTVKGSRDKIKPLNEFASLSARAFSVEETRRYAAAFSDPARMAQNFPGVSNAGDMDNSIVVRGNSPKGVLWRMEGIEIPNPNHFTSLGASGGAISMLNANTLGNSDFYTGAFVPEIGNALSGAFDLNLRNGNTQKREHTIQIGTLGAELATEGPLGKNKRASYLINYRYSTLAILQQFVDLNGVVPKYQDGSFKVNMPTNKAGTFTVWGLGGYNKAANTPEADSSKWTDDKPNEKFNSTNYMMVGGVSHQYFIKKDAYIKTIVSASQDKSEMNADTLNPTDSYKNVPVNHTQLSNTAIRASLMYNQKLNAHNTFRAGIIGQQINYDLELAYFDNQKHQWKQILSGNGGTQFYQGYIQWKSRLSEQFTVIGGIHGSYLALNSKYSIEPRISATYQINKNKFSIATGFHSKPEHISTYLFQNTVKGQNFTYPNKNLDLQRAYHAVAGYETSLPLNTKMKVEVYYQYLYHIPVEQDSNSYFSIINALDVYSLINTKPLVSKGTGQNYGIDLSLERPFANNYYVLATGSLFKSTYNTYGGQTYNTLFNRGYQVNIVGGKEFKLNAKGRSIIGLNGKVLTSGGIRESIIDLAQSRANKEATYVKGSYYTQQAPAYFRADAGIYYKVNNKRATHTIQLDVQNVSNRKNYYFSHYDANSGNVKTEYQLGILPNLSYRIDFH